MVPPRSGSHQGSLFAAVAGCGLRESEDRVLGGLFRGRVLSCTCKPGRRHAAHLDVCVVQAAILGRPGAGASLPDFRLPVVHTVRVACSVRALRGLGGTGGRPRLTPFLPALGHTAVRPDFRGRPWAPSLRLRTVLPLHLFVFLLQRLLQLLNSSCLVP